MLENARPVSPQKMLFIASKIFSINPARVIINKNQLIAGKMKITFIDENYLIIKIDNVSIDLTFWLIYKKYN